MFNLKWSCNLDGSRSGSTSRCHSCLSAELPRSGDGRFRGRRDMQDWRVRHRMDFGGMRSCDERRSLQFQRSHGGAHSCGFLHPLQELGLRHGSFEGDPFIHDCLRNAEDLIALRDIRKLRYLDHVGSNQRTLDCQLVGQPGHAWAVGSGWRDKDLDMYRGAKHGAPRPAHPSIQKPQTPGSGTSQSRGGSAPAHRPDPGR